MKAAAPVTAAAAGVAQTDAGVEWDETIKHSFKYEGLALYLSRLLCPVWLWSVTTLDRPQQGIPKAEDQYQCSRFSRKDMQEV